MKNGDRVEDEEGIVWIIQDCSDIHNVKLTPEHQPGWWLACLEPDCKDSDLSIVTFLD